MYNSQYVHNTCITVSMVPLWNFTLWSTALYSVYCIMYGLYTLWQYMCTWVHNMTTCTQYMYVTWPTCTWLHVHDYMYTIHVCYMTYMYMSTCTQYMYVTWPTCTWLHVHDYMYTIHVCYMTYMYITHVCYRPV